MKFDSLDTFVRDCAFMNGGLKENEYIWYLRQTIRCLEDLNFNLFPPVKTKKFIIQANWSVVLPDDFVRPVKVLQITGDSKLGVVPLGSKTLFTALKETTSDSFFDCCPTLVESTTTEVTVQGTETSKYYLNHYYFGEIYGKTEKLFPAYYDFYEEKNILAIFSPFGLVSTGEELLIEYEYTGAQSRYMIPRDIFLMLSHRVLQHYYIGRNRGQSEDHFRHFKIQINMYKRSKNRKFTLDDYINAFREAYHNAPR